MVVFTRRDALGAVGLVGFAGLAGCTAAPEPSDPATDGGTRPPDATRRVTVVSRDDPPDLPVRPRVSLADPFATDGSPPVLRADVENPTDDPVVVAEYREVVFQYVGAVDAPFVLLPHSERSTTGDPDRTGPPFETVGDGCWRLTDRVAVTMEYGTVEIPAGGTLTAFVGLYGVAGSEGCLPPGEYRFEATYAHYPEGLDGGDPDTATWGLRLRVDSLDPEG